ncbi:MAG: bile acid:sodium symporter family protein [Gemmataceae bacterium]
MRMLQRICLGIAAVGLLLAIAGWLTGAPLWRPAAVTACLGLAVGLAAVPALAGYQFTAWIIAAVTAAMIYPPAFLRWGDFDLRNRWLLLVVVQTVMFGMGTQMRLEDFAGVLKMPWTVFVGIAGHFTIMPVVGWALTKAFAFPDEIAAGVILIGSCSSGLASNVMCYLARANLPLAVTVTAVTTMLAPIMTPLWMKLLAGTLVEVHVFDMMMEIVKIVLVPITAALVHDYLKHASPQGRRLVLGTAAVGATWLAFLVVKGRGSLVSSDAAAATAIDVLGFLLGATVVGVAYHGLTRRFHRLDSLMPRASMAGIVYFTAVTTAAGRDNLLQVGGLLFLAAAAHNAAGYCCGYWLSRVCGLDKNSARAVAFEVGLQNGGMAAGLAASMGKLATVGLPAAIFSPWMNVSGSVLANYWRKRPAN